MKLLRRLPVYATGVGFAALLLATAEARNWNDLTFFLASLGVALFYTLTVLVPWLIHDQISHQPPKEPVALLYWYEVAIRDVITGATIKPNGENGTSEVPVTHGRGVATHGPTSVLTR